MSLGSSWQTGGFCWATQPLIPTPSSYMPLAKEAHTDEAACVRQGWDWLWCLHQGQHRLCGEGRISIPSKRRPRCGQTSPQDPDAGIGYCTLPFNFGPNYKHPSTGPQGFVGEELYYSPRDQCMGVELLVWPEPQASLSCPHPGPDVWQELLFLSGTCQCQEDRHTWFCSGLYLPGIGRKCYGLTVA